MAHRIAWSVSHHEFTIEDGYYFSVLRRALEEAGVQVVPVERLEDAFDAPVLVLNYPEDPFTPEEVRWLEAYVAQGGRLVALAYYQNEDRVAEILNAVARPFGLRFGYDHVQDPVHKHGEDPYMVVTRRVNGVPSVARVLLPYAAPVHLEDRETLQVLVEAESTAQVPSGSRVLAAQARHGRGTFIAVGTCVFWDNYAITAYDNLAFAFYLLGVPHDTQREG